MLVGFDLRCPADLINNASVIKSIAIISARACILRINIAVGYSADSRAIGFILFISICADKPAVDLLPDVGVVPPVAAVEHGVALSVTMDVCGGRAVGIDLSGVGMRGEGAVVQFVYRRAVVERVLTGGDRRVLNDADRSVVRDIVALSDRIRAADVAVIDTVCAVDRAGINQLDLSAVIEYRVTARREDRDVGHRGDRRTIVQYDRNVAVDVLQVLERNIRNAQRSSIEVADNGRMVGDACIADRVRGYPSASDAVRDGHIAAVDNCRHALIDSRRGSRAGGIIPRAAVELKGKRALINDTADGIVTVQVKSNVVGGIGTVCLSRQFILESTAISEERDGSRCIRRCIRKRVYQSFIVTVRIAVISNNAIVEAEDVDRALGSFAHGNDAAVRITAGIGPAGQVPCDGIMVRCSNTHRSVGRRCILGTDCKRCRCLINNVIGFIVDRGRVRNCVACIQLINRILLLVQDESGYVFRSSTGEGNNAVRRNAGNVNVGTADRRSTVGSSRSDIRKPACVISDSIVVFAEEITLDQLVVIHEIYDKAVPMLAVLIVLPGARAGARSQGIAVITIMKFRSIEVHRSLRGVIIAFVDSGACCRGCCENELSVCSVQSFGAGYIRTVFGGKQGALHVYRTVNVDSGVFKVRFCSNSCSTVCN